MSIASNSADNSVLLPYDTILGTLNVSLGLSSLVLGLALSVLVTAGGLPRLGTSEVADGLDYGTLQRVILTGSLAAEVRGWLVRA